MSFRFPDIAVQAFLHRRHERSHFGGLAVGLQLHTAIRQALDLTRDVELLRDLQGLIAKANALHPTREKHCLKMHFDHRGSRTVPRRRFRFNP